MFGKCKIPKGVADDGEVIGSVDVLSLSILFTGVDGGVIILESTPSHLSHCLETSWKAWIGSGSVLKQGVLLILDTCGKDLVNDSLVLLVGKGYES